MPAFNPLDFLRRLRVVRRPRPTGLRPLPIWALGELRLTAAEAAWLQRAQLCCLGLPTRVEPRSRTSPSLGETFAPLAQHGFVLQAFRFDDLRLLRRGDVIWLHAAATVREGTADPGGRLALVVDAGADWLRLSPALADGPLTRRHAELRGMTGGWLLRAELRSPAPTVAAHWDPGWSVVG